MKRNLNNDPIVPLMLEYRKIMKEANLLAVVNRELAQQRFNRAQYVAVQIAAMRFRNL